MKLVSSSFHYWVHHTVQVADKLVALVKPMVEKLKVGMPEDDADITPVVSETSANFIEGLVNDAKEKGGWERT
jgi:glyceraldehyde-3-phosphate dehydrogenase (NADP+)